MPGVRVHTANHDEAERLCGEVYFPHRLTLRHDPATFSVSLAALELGPISAGLLAYRGEVVVTTGELETGYEINVPLHEPLRTRAGEDEMCATPELAAVYRPDDRTTLHGWRSGGQLFGLKINRETLEHTLAELIGRPVRTPIKLDRTIPLRSGAGQQWWALTRTLTTAIHDPDGPLTSPIVARPLVHSIITALLHAVDHPYRGALSITPPDTGPHYVQKAIDLMESRPHSPLTVREIAEHVGVSTRALQQGFARYQDISPMGYLREVRLRRAHEDLRAGDPTQHTVAEIAHRWGFTHLGRFATSYRSRFGTTPSQTLRSSQ